MSHSVLEGSTSARLTCRGYPRWTERQTLDDYATLLRARVVPSCVAGTPAPELGM